jgi:heme exporter protein B
MNVSTSAEKSDRWVSQAWAVLTKDLLTEVRVAAASTAVGMFALVTLAVVSYAVGSASLDPVLEASLLWIVLFFSSSVGLSRTFVKEEETKTALALRLTANPSVVFGGKLAFNCLLMFLLALLLVPLYIILMSVSIPSPLLFIAVLGVGLLGLAGGSTIIAAIISKVRVKGPLFGALTFPVLLPLLMLLVRTTTSAFEGDGWEQVSRDLLGLLGFAGAMITASFLLFDSVWES